MVIAVAGPGVIGHHVAHVGAKHVQCPSLDKLPYFVGREGLKGPHGTSVQFGRRALRRLSLGYFGASTGAGAALVAAAELPGIVSAIVSRGGRPDLAGSTLGLVRAPTLLIVGGEDEPVITLNREVLARLPSNR